MGNIEMGFDLHMDLVQLLSPDGEISKAASTSAKDIERLVRFYRAMTRTRIFDNKAISLQRTGQLGTFA
ncbi:MAG: pyruvate dehydrogenase (Acetyl-transferring) E1 component subunit alpha, partial [Methylocystaceae bacterium]